MTQLLDLSIRGFKLKLGWPFTVVSIVLLAFLFGQGQQLPSILQAVKSYTGYQLPRERDHERLQRSAAAY